MAIPNAAAKYIFGVKSSVVNNIAFHDEQTLVYPAGSYVVLFNVDQKQQKFILGSEKGQGITAQVVSPNRRLLAIAEKGERPTITIYDLITLRKRKILNCLDVQGQECVSLAFSHDSKFLIAQCNHPDWTLVLWQWEKARVLGSIKTSKSDSMSPVHQVAFSPFDNTHIVVVGEGIFKLYKFTEGNIKQCHQAKASELQNFTALHWSPEDRIIVGTDNGRVMLFEEGEHKADYYIYKPGTNTKKDNDKHEHITSESHQGSIPANMYKVTSIATYSKGTRIACACGQGTVHLFERGTETKTFFKKTKEIKVPERSLVAEGTEDAELILTLAISPSEETLVASTDRNQIFSMTLSSADLGTHKEAVRFETASQLFHSNIISGLDVCIRKPWFATCSMDKSIRIWNFETCSLELYKEFQEEVYSVAFHPSGLYILAGFSDKVRLMNLLIDDIRTFKEFMIRGCRECRFSNGGHLFVAVHGNVIQVYSTVTFENVANLKGHNGKVKVVIWTLDDSRIISCGWDGAVYSWDVSTGKRLGECVIKSCSYNSVCVAPDGFTTFAVGSDQSIKEIALKSATESQVTHDVDSRGTTLTAVATAHSGRMLFSGSAQGTLQCMKSTTQGNLAVPGEWQEHQAHSSQITRMAVTYDDQFLVTVSDDACIILWKVSEREGRALMKRDKDIIYSEEILITKSDLEEKNSLMSELKTRVEELKMENEYQLRLKDMNYNEKYKDMTDKFVLEMEEIKNKSKALELAKERQEARHGEQLQTIQESHATELEQLEAANNKKLMMEYEKYEELQARMHKLQEEFEVQLREAGVSKERACEELTEYYEAKLLDKSQQLEQVHEESRQKNKEYEETKRQIEEDADSEILDLKNKYERKLREEKEANLRLKGETGIMRKKFTSLQKEIDDHKAEITKLQTEQGKLLGVIRSLEKDIVGLHRQIQERDETIQDKEKRIYDLKKKNQELEKFKFVLDYKIKELKKQIEPRENEVKEMKEQIQAMEGELERFHKLNTQLDLNVTELRQKLRAVDRELSSERQTVQDLGAMMKRFRTDLHNCVGYIQEPKKLKECLKILYQKHVQQDKENVALIKEINELRQEVKTARNRVHDLECMNAVQQKTAGRSQVLLLKDSATSLHSDTEEKDKVIEIQRTEIRRLHTQIRDLEASSRPPSGVKLQPLTVL
ncbi:PREDICTED: cilia- and flagella-associated protein 57-like isoform X2 [Priapulus caudatus]|uniref:Cilia- and flagella-associated protein 57-like isoform X2 n=1 Tax=Priapulus caudatus TaxID=37621 RepID=A0ABM1E554_PRICU|nr:PREDICTED: cilia- and flagella-associated protein 57-like isoform X2 [Priapulus caudatus]